MHGLGTTSSRGGLGVTIASAFAPFTHPGFELEGLPEAELTVAPTSIVEAEQVLDLASEHQLRTVVWGGGTHQGLGGRVEPDLIVSTARLDQTVDWQPEDLTVTVGAGVMVEDLEASLADRGQTAVLPEVPGRSTVGGVLASGVSGWRRLRYGPTRDRVLEVDLVTGDGRHVRAGGRVVKNVTGFDLSRLAVGSFGSLGLIAQTCLKLWPLPSATLTVSVQDGDEALATAYRPIAVVETNGAARVFLGGTEAEVEGQAEMLGGTAASGWSWDPEPVGAFRWSLRLPPSEMREAVVRLPDSWTYQAGLGAGEVRAASADPDGANELRSWAESRGGALVIADGPADLYAAMDPWGTAPSSLQIQRRLVARFDPVRILNPGRLPGGV